MRSVAVLVLLAVTSAAVHAAETWPRPRTSIFTADWISARAALPAMPQSTASPDPWHAANVLARERFPAIANSPVPVLLPYAIGDDAHDRSTDDVNPLESYLSGFEPTKFFHVGPTGYDATFILRTHDTPGFADIGYKNPVVVQISAFNLLYELPEPKGAIILPPGDIAKDFPGIRRQILEHTLRYSFERFGIPYVVSIQCYDGPQRPTRLACRNADRVALRFLRALRMVGGNPFAPQPAATAAAVERPDKTSDAFRYHPAGSLVAGTAMRASSGDPDRTVYARMRFPVAAAPAYVNTQAFKKQSGLVIAWAPAADDENEADARPKAMQYVWRDNFCERRHFAVGQCPSGLGHQGQDILGPTCDPGPRKRDCPANRDEVVAARDGMILRESWNDSFFLSVNARGERLRFRHLHMHPRKLDDDRIFSGRIVTEGQRLGTIGNYNRRPGMTTTHLHFELQVPTRDGYVRVNPYMTLVASYEQLIGARGSELTPAMPITGEEAPANATAASNGEMPIKTNAVAAPEAIKAAVVPDTIRLKPQGGGAKFKAVSRATSKAKTKNKARVKVSTKARLARASGRNRR